MTKPFNPQDWSLENETAKRVDLEALALWGQGEIANYNPPLPKYEKGELKWSEVVKHAFGRGVRMFSL